MDRPRALTQKQQRFVEHYAASGNALEAARQAGYRKPDPEGARLLGNARIQQAIRAFTKETDEKRIALAKERQEFWTAVMRGEYGEYHDVPFRDRLKASELLGRAQGDFIDRVDGTLRIVIERKPR